MPLSKAHTVSPGAPDSYTQQVKATCVLQVHLGNPPLINKVKSIEQLSLHVATVSYSEHAGTGSRCSEEHDETVIITSEHRADTNSLSLSRQI